MICTRCKQDKSINAFVYRSDRQRHQSICKDCKKKQDRHWSEHNRDNRRMSKTKSDNKLRATRPIIKLKNLLRNRLNSAMYNMKLGKTISHVRDLGCSMDQFVSYIEAKFYPHKSGLSMSWSNHGNGSGKWQIDHILPFCHCNTEDDMLRCINYTNLQPLWWDEHLLKSIAERSACS